MEFAKLRALRTQHAYVPLRLGYIKCQISFKTGHFSFLEPKTPK